MKPVETRGIEPLTPALQKMLSLTGHCQPVPFPACSCWSSGVPWRWSSSGVSGSDAFPLPLTPPRDTAGIRPPAWPRHRVPHRLPGHLLAKSRIFDGTLPMLAPSRELRLFFDSMPRRYKAGLAMSFTVTIAYKNKRGKEFNEDTVTDMDIARGSVQFEVYGVHHLAKSLRAIEKTQKKIADHLRNPIQVTTEDWKAHDERMKEDEAEMRAAGSCSAGSGVICGSGVTLLGVSA